MMQKISGLRYLDTHNSPASFAKKLSISSIELLVWISKINQIESLIGNHSGDNLVIKRKLDWLDLKKISKNLKDLQINGYTVDIVDEVDSTNNYVLNNLAKFSDKTVFVAEYQASGKARNSQTWQARMIQDITASFVYQFDTNFNYGLLPLVVGVGVNRLFKQYGIRNKIKWPNDVIMVEDENREQQKLEPLNLDLWCNDKKHKNYAKIAGILVESCIKSGKRLVVIGVGVDNIANWDRNALLANLIKHIANVIDEYKIFDFSVLKREWLDNCIHYKTKIKLQQGNKLLASGLHMDLADDGGVIINNNGKYEKYTGSNISLLEYGV